MDTAEQALADYEAGPIPMTCEELGGALLKLIRAEPPALADVRTTQRMGVLMENLGARQAALRQDRRDAA